MKASRRPKRKTALKRPKTSRKAVKNPRKAIKTVKKVVKKLIVRARRKLLSQEDLEATKFDTSTEKVVSHGRLAQESRGFELPARYGENKAVLLVRDPWWIFAYWEFTPEREREVLEAIRREGLRQEKTVMRVYDVTDGGRSFFDIEIGPASNWYVDVGKPDRQWVVELGIRTHEGKFFMLVRSNTVRTPRFGVSDVLDEEWLLPDDLYWKLFGLAGGFGRQKSSLHVKEILERYLKSIVSSADSSKIPVLERS